MLRDAFVAVHELALDQHGYFTAEQAREVGVNPQAVVMMCRRGTIERAAHGVYYDRLVPATPLAPYMAAVLWPHGVRGVLSHETALDLLGLSDVNPDKIHITVPKGFRVRRLIPTQYVLHNAELGRKDVTRVEGIPVTTALRTIWDCRAAHVSPALLRQAIEDGVRTGRLAPRDAIRLEDDLDGTRAADTEMVTRNG